jgi:uncharacterized protein YbjT (DUF2867 family)
MNPTANDQDSSVEENNRFGQLAPFSIESARGNTSVKAARSLRTFTDVGDDTGFAPLLFIVSGDSPAMAPEEALAIGVLSQAAHDLRRFHLAIEGVERELYRDAFSWFVTTDSSWPCSFVNVCKALRVSPESIRKELLADVSLGWLGHWTELSERLGPLLRDSLAQVFASSRKANNSKPRRSAAAFQQPGNRSPFGSLLTENRQRKHMNNKMKIVVIGGSGLIGTKLVSNLRKRGHEVVAASPSSGVNTITGEGLAEALEGAQVVVDVANSPSWEDKAVLDFFETSGRNLLSAEAVAGVRHHVALSVVGTDRLLTSGYFRAKMAQENLIKASPIPYTIVRATQFFEFVSGIAQSATEGATVRLPSALMQPIVSDDVAAALADVAIAEPLNDTVELAGPEPIRMDEFVRRFLNANGDPRKVITDAHALYYGIKVNEQSLVPGDNPLLASTRFEDWLRRSTAQRELNKTIE